MTGTEPVVRRVIEIPVDYSLYELHLALQICLGYNDFEAFEFVGENLTVGTEASYAGAGIDHEGHRYRHADEVMVEDLYDHVGQVIDYTYDFSRLWGFKLEVLHFAEAETQLPNCLESFEAAPPEDCDSLAAYYGLLIAAADPSLEIHELALIILGDDFDRDGPQADDLTQLLHQLFGDDVEPHGTEADASDEYDWWDPSKYDESMRIRVKQQEIADNLPVGLERLDKANKHATLLEVLRGGTPRATP